MLGSQGRVADHLRATREIARLKCVFALVPSSSQLEPPHTIILQ